jgi:hypothetical protein
MEELHRYFDENLTQVGDDAGFEEMPAASDATLPHHQAAYSIYEIVRGYTGFEYEKASARPGIL